jgi:hypothetical protein
MWWVGEPIERKKERTPQMMPGALLLALAAVFGTADTSPAHHPTHKPMHHLTRKPTDYPHQLRRNKFGANSSLAEAVGITIILVHAIFAPIDLAVTACSNV